MQSTSTGPQVAEIILEHLIVFGYLAFLWIPLVFLAYAIGRRQLTIRFFFAFTCAEGAAVALALYIPS